MSKSDGQVICDFCGKSQSQVEKIMVGGFNPDVAICNECVDLCIEVFEL